VKKDPSSQCLEEEMPQDINNDVEEEGGGGRLGGALSDIQSNAQGCH
jgi:hypothetical protein